MKPQSKRTRNALGLNLTLCVVATGFACGQARVDMKKVEKVVINQAPPASSTASVDAPEWEEAFEPSVPTGEVYSRTYLPINNASQLQDWQTWAKPKRRGKYTLSAEERVSLGDPVEDGELDYGDTGVKLQARGSSYRCVFRNRLINKDTAQAKLVHLSAPMGEQDLLCVERKLGPGQEPSVRLAVNEDVFNGGVTWLGTKARRDLPQPEEVTHLELKVSQLVGFQQGFSRAIQDALPDHWDALINSAMAGQATGRDCGVTRSALLQLRMERARVVSGRLVVHTRLMSNREQASTRRVFTQPDVLVPMLDLQAKSACEPQRKAWVACLTGDAQCSEPIARSLETNFGALLGARMNGFISERAFTVTRAEANGIGPRGAKDMAIWRETAVTAKAEVESGGSNPLSVEDFQEMIEITDLYPAKFGR